MGLFDSIGGLLGFRNGGSTAGLGDSADMAFAQAQKEKELLNQQYANRGNFANQLYDQASGKAPSFAEMQMKAAQDRGLAQQVAAAQANRGVNAGLQSRNLQMGAAQQNTALTQNAGFARMQEQLANQGQYSNYISGQQQNLNGLMGVNQAAQSGLYNANTANAENQNKFIGGLISAGGQLGAAAMGMPAMPKTTATPTDTSVPSSEGFTMPSSPLNRAFGGKIPGKAPVKGDSTANDIVSAKLSPGEVVIPRTVAEKGGKAAADFVDKASAGEESSKAEPSAFLKALAAKATSKPESVTHGEVVKGFGHVLAAHKEMLEKLAEIKKGKKG